MHVLTLDQGTSSLKAALWRADGTVAAESVQMYELSRPAATWAEIDPGCWWEAICTAIPAAQGRAGISADDLRRAARPRRGAPPADAADPRARPARRGRGGRPQGTTRRSRARRP